MIKQKYQPVLDLGTELNIQNGEVTEQQGILLNKGIAKTQYEKNILWDKIKAIGGENPSDIFAKLFAAIPQDIPRTRNKYPNKGFIFLIN